MSFLVAVENQFDFLSAEYLLLYARSAATAFQHPLWLAAFYARLLAPNAAQPLVVTVRRKTDRALLLVLPLVRRRYAALTVVEFADLRVCDYVSAVAEPATFAELAGDAEVRRQIRRCLGRHDVLRITKVRDDALSLEQLLDIRQRVSMGMNAYAVALGSDYETWRAERLAPSYRKELDKKRRQLQRRGDVRFECSTDPESIRASFEALTRFRRERFGDSELLQLPPYRDFYFELVSNPGGGFTRLYTMLVDNRPVAAALGLVHREALLVVMSGFAATEYKNVSLGSLTFEAVAQDCIARGQRLLDFTIGDEAYKLTFGAKPSPMWRIARAGTPVGFAAQQLVDRLPPARALAKDILRKLRRSEHSRWTVGSIPPPDTSANRPRKSGEAP